MAKPLRQHSGHGSKGWFNPAEQAEKMAGISDGAIVGSAIIEIIGKYGRSAPAYVGEYVREMKDAVIRGSYNR